jgi:hypothetical protein
MLTFIKSLFKKKDQSQVGEPSVQTVPVPALTPTTDFYETEAIEALDQEVPYWLDNEDMLRDEGVIFGLTGVNPTEKTASIKLFFSQKTAGAMKEIEQLNEKIQELNLEIGDKEEKINALKSKSENLENKEVRDEQHLLRTIVGLSLSIVMCVANFYLIEESLRPSFSQSFPIAIGVFMAGMFNLFDRTSLLHEKREFSFRNLAEEIGLPLAASLFIFVQIADKQPLLKAFGLFFFTFCLFLFAGKLFLGNLTTLKRDFDIWLEKRNLSNQKRTKIVEWEEQIEQLEADINTIRTDKWKILPRLNKLEAEVSKIDAQRDMLIKLFESEFNLAKSHASKLSPKQFRDILGTEE